MNLLLFRKINKIIPVAESVKEDVLRKNWFLSPGKLSVLENSIDYERFADVSVSKKDAKQILMLPLHAFVFGTVGRLAPMKGQRYLIEAFKMVKQNIPSAELVLVGDGFLRKSLERQAAETGYGDSIHFLGKRNNVEVMYKAMDLFVLSSVASEGMPRVIIEAMAAKVPCVATMVGGIPEIIDDENTGLLVPLKDSGALAQAMIRIATMPRKELDKLIGNAQNRIREFYSHQVVREKLRRLYESEFDTYCKNFEA